MGRSLIEKIKVWAEIADELREPVSEDEMASLTKDIQENGEYIIQAMEESEEAAARLKSKADKFKTAYLQEVNRGKNLKNYFKSALKKNGFKKMTFGDWQVGFSTTHKLVPLRAPTEFDYMNKPEWVSTSMSWAREPDLGDFGEYPGLVKTSLEWNINPMKKSFQDGDEDAAGIFEKVDIDRLTIKVSKKG